MKKIVLGTAQFSGDYGVTRTTKNFTKKESHKILKTCYLKKIRHLDTSIDYENSLKKISSFKYKDWQITTKIDPKKLNFSSEHNLYLSLERQILLFKKKSSQKTIKNLLIRNADIMQTSKGKILFKVLKKIKKKKLIVKMGGSLTAYSKDFIIKLYKQNLIDRVLI